VADLCDFCDSHKFVTSCMYTNLGRDVLQAVNHHHLNAKVRVQSHIILCDILVGQIVSKAGFQLLLSLSCQLFFHQVSMLNFLNSPTTEINAVMDLLEEFLGSAPVNTAIMQQYTTLRFPARSDQRVYLEENSDAKQFSVSSTSSVMWRLCVRYSAVILDVCDLIKLLQFLC
jgi:hypothetical protein